MPESDDEARAKKQRMRERADRQAAEERRVGSNERRRERVRLISAGFAFLGFLLWAVVMFVEPESETVLKFLVAAAQLWPILIVANVSY